MLEGQHMLNWYWVMVIPWRDSYAFYLDCVRIIRIFQWRDSISLYIVPTMLKFACLNNVIVFNLIYRWRDSICLSGTIHGYFVGLNNHIYANSPLWIGLEAGNGEM
jgi:hypothetical protein